MSILYRSKKRFLDPNERVTYAGLDLLAKGTAIVEAETVGTAELKAADLATAMAAVPIETALSFTKNGDQTIAANGSVVLIADTPAAPAGTTIDSIIVVDQIFTYIYMGGWVAGDPNTPDTFQISFEAHNMQSTPETITNGTVIRYRVHNGAPTVQAIMPNAALTVTPGKTWLNPDGTNIDEPISAVGLNQTAVPTIAIPNDSITEIELNSSDIRKAAASLTGKRGTFITAGGPTSVPPGPKVSLGALTITGATTSMIARVGQPAGNTAGPLFTARVSSSNTVTIYAVNDSYNTFSVADGQLLNVICY